MKKFLAFLPVVSFALALLFLGCKNPSVPDGLGVDPSNPNPPVPEGMARVIIPLPSSAPLARLGVPIKEAEQFADRYDVFFTNKSAGNVIEASAAKGKESIIVEIPEGTYDILLLAVESKRGGSPLLLASSYVLNRSVSLATENKVEMTMASIHLEIAAPLKTPVLAEYDVGFTFNPQNPLLTSPNSINFSVNNAQHQGNQWETYPAKVGIQYGYDVTLEAPLNTGISEIVFSEASVTVKGSGNQDKRYRFADASHSELGKYFRTAIEFVKAGDFPELEITIVYPTEETPPPPRPLAVRFTLTGIPAQYQNLYQSGGSLSLSLLSPDGKTVATGQATSGTTMSFLLRTGTEYNAPIFTATGDHKAVLRVKKDSWTPPELFEYAMNVRPGTNSVAWTSFKQSEFISLQVEIHDFYREVSISLVTQDGKTVAWGNSNWDRDEQYGPFLTFILRAGREQTDPLFTATGDYRVILRVQYEDRNRAEYYEYSNTTFSLGNKMISLFDFKVLSPLAIRVTNIPAQYRDRNLYGVLALLPPGSNNVLEIEGEGDVGGIFDEDSSYISDLWVYGVLGCKNFDIILAFGTEENLKQGQGPYEELFRANNVYIQPAGGGRFDINFQNFTSINKLPWE